LTHKHQPEAQARNDVFPRLRFGLVGVEFDRAMYIRKINEECGRIVPLLE
jgi:hypothetical protein